MTRPKARRDFILDSGGVSYLAESDQHARSFRAHISQDYDGASILVPIDVLTESLTGNPRRDAKVNRLLKKIADPADPEGFWLHLTPIIAVNAAALRAQAVKRGAATAKRPISVVDAHVVAFAVERSALCPVTIVTSDPGDIQMLVDLTGRTNIAVVVV